MIAPEASLTDLKCKRPEWEPWLEVVEEILREAGASTWDAVVPEHADARRAAVPILAGATLAVPARSVRRLLDRLIRIVSRTGTPKMATLQAAAFTDAELLPLFAATLRQDDVRIGQIAAGSNADAEALQAVVALLPVPLLHACHRRWAPSIDVSWVEGYCPVCGSWPAFAELCGIERSRYFRCGRCGGQWHARALCCPYCAMSDHDELVSLVPEKAGSNAVIEACKRCRGYVKAFTRLQGCPPGSVMLEDLASVDLDVAVIEQGYTRPSGGGYPLDVAVTGNGAGRRFFSWKS